VLRRVAAAHRCRPSGARAPRARCPTRTRGSRATGLRRSRGAPAARRSDGCPAPSQTFVAPRCARCRRCPRRALRAEAEPGSDRSGSRGGSRGRHPDLLDEADGIAVRKRGDGAREHVEQGQAERDVVEAHRVGSCAAHRSPSACFEPRRPAAHRTGHSAPREMIGQRLDLAIAE
jgi:hypothetical protein